MLTDVSPPKQEQTSNSANKSDANESPSLPTPNYLQPNQTKNQTLEFINEAPPVDENLSEYLEKKLLEYEEQQRKTAKNKNISSSKIYTKHNPTAKPPTKKQTKLSNLHKLIYVLKLFHIPFIKVDPSRQTIADMAGVHVNTFDNHKKALKHEKFLDWKSGKKTWETNQYFLKDHVQNQIMTRPEGVTIPKFLFMAIQNILEKLNWSDKQKFYLQLIKDVVHHQTLRVRRLRAFEEKKEEKRAKDPPKTRAGPKRPILKQLLAPLELNFRDQAILSSYGEAPLRTAINDLNTYSGKILNVVAFLISRCKAIKSKLEDLSKELTATPEENINWLKDHLTKDSVKSRLKFFTDKEKINRSTLSAIPYINLRIHKTEPEKSKLIIKQKVNGYWIDKIIDLTRKNLRTAVVRALEIAFKSAEEHRNKNLSCHSI